MTIIDIKNFYNQIVFFGFCPGADFSRRLDTRWKELGICEFQYFESKIQVKRFASIEVGDLIVLKKRQIIGKTMRVYGYGLVTGITKDDKGNRVLKVDWSSQEQIIEVPLMGCNATIDIRDIDKVRSEMPDEFFQWLNQGTDLINPSRKYDELDNPQRKAVTVGHKSIESVFADEKNPIPKNINSMKIQNNAKSTISNVTQELIDKANSGNRNSMWELANIYQQEAEASEQNTFNAIKYWTMAANLGCVASQYTLGGIFESDPIKSVYWNTLAYEGMLSSNWSPKFIATTAYQLSFANLQLGDKAKSSHYAKIILSKDEYMENLYEWFEQTHNDTRESVRELIDHLASLSQDQEVTQCSDDETSIKDSSTNMKVTIRSSTPTKWIIEPNEIKSVVDVECYVKGNNKLRIETGWRWARYYVYTDDTNPPKLEAYSNIYDSGYKVELIETFDNCWTENDDSDCDEESQEWLSEFLEDNSVFDLENEGWDLKDTETYFTCDFDIKPA